MPRKVTKADKDNIKAHITGSNGKVSYRSLYEHPTFGTDHNLTKAALDELVGEGELDFVVEAKQNGKPELVYMVKGGA